MSQRDEPATAGSSPDSTPAKRRRGPGKPLQPGYDPRRNIAGRPPKGESFGEKYLKRLDKDAEALIDRHIKRALGDNVVAERAFSTALAYRVGIPKQTFVVETQDSPMAALLAELAHLQALPAPYVEGEAHEVDG